MCWKAESRKICNLRWTTIFLTAELKVLYGWAQCFVRWNNKSLSAITHYFSYFLYSCAKCFQELKIFYMFTEQDLYRKTNSLYTVAQTISYGWTKCFVYLHKMFRFANYKELYSFEKIVSYGCQGACMLGKIVVSGLALCFNVLEGGITEKM